MEWFRSHHGAPTDPKWLVIANKAGTRPGVVAAVWWALMDRASQSTPRGSVSGFDVEAIAAFYGWSEAEVQGVYDALEAKGMIQEGAIVKWSDRQPKREDDSSERVRRYRERAKRIAEDVTHGNATKREVTLEERRVEEKREENPPTSPDGEVVPPPAPPSANGSAVTLLGNGGAEALEAMRPPNGTRAALAAIRMTLLYDNEAGATPDRAVKGLPLPERRDLVARALVEMHSAGKSWNPALLVGYVRNLRSQPPPRDAPATEAPLTKAQYARYREIRAALEEGGMDPDEAAEEADRRARK